MIGGVVVNPEQSKYERMWARDEYREVAPAERWVSIFLEHAKPPQGESLIDFGCGTGRGGLQLATLGGLDVTLVDFAENCLDEEVRASDKIKFVRADLTEPIPVSAAYGYCCDVMEHIPTDDVPKVLHNIFASVRSCFFAIACFHDSHGELIGETLHMTVRPPSWWRGEIEKAGGEIAWDFEYADVAGNRVVVLQCTRSDAAEVHDNPERAKYERIWREKEYREVAPGEQWVMTFLQQAHVEKDAEVIDFGCGTGRGGLQLALFGAMNVTLLDFANNCLDNEVWEACISQPTRIRFVNADLTKTISVNAAYGYCCDVMEHIPTDDVPRVLANILGSAQHCFFAISTVEDKCGALIGEPLHLTIKSAQWWLEKIRKAGAVIHWSQELDGACAVFCTAWSEAGEIVKTGKLNTDEAVVDAQIAENVRAGWLQAMPHDRQDREVVFLAGGPSMAECIDEIRKLRAEGACLVTCNGSYKWAIDQGLSISAQIVLDARAFNARFTRPVIDHCKYLIASQAHPSTLEGLPHDRTLLWHSCLSDENEKLIREITGQFFPVPGGSTVVLRAIPLLRLLGYWRIHLFGFDSCVKSDGTHHAYAQAENDNEVLIPVTCGGRTFQCTPWMCSQASELRELCKFMGDEVELAVYGDGLIAAMIKSGATFATKEN